MRKGKLEMNKFIRLWKNVSGASAAEYALILAIIGAAIAIAAITLGGTIGNAMNSASTCISSKGKTC
jgi:pilus assembly protein Flp/PilA